MLSAYRDLAVKFDANLTNKSEMIYDTVMSW